MTTPVHRSPPAGSAGPAPASIEKARALATQGAGVRAVPRELQLMWLDLLHKDWRSLALVPLEDGAGAREAADDVAEIARFFDLGRVHVVDARGATLADADRLRLEMKAQTDAGARVIVAIDPPLGSGGAIAPLMAADAAVVLVRLGTSELEAVRSVAQIARRERILGCVAIHPRHAAAPR